VFLQKYKDAKLSDVKTFESKEGLSWNLGDRTRTETNILEWQGTRASAGKLPPVGFPRDNRF
jgi:topoisomerase-4 subunit A